MQWKSRHEYASFTRCIRKKGFLGILGVSKNCGRSQTTPIIRCSTGWSLLRSKVTKWITFSPKRFPLHPNLERDDSLFQFISSYETFIYIYLPCDVPSGSSYHQRSWRSPSCVSAARICKAPAVDWSAWRDRPAAQAKYQTQPVGASSALHGIESATAHSIKWSHM
jgi:hypothetical protein